MDERRKDDRRVPIGGWGVLGPAGPARYRFDSLTRSKLIYKHPFLYQHANSGRRQRRALATSWKAVQYVFTGVEVSSAHVYVVSGTEEFDKLCFDYGLELDEDVRCKH